MSEKSQVFPKFWTSFLLDFEIVKTILKRRRNVTEAKQRQQYLLTRRLKSLLPFPPPSPPLSPPPSPPLSPSPSFLGNENKFWVVFHLLPNCFQILLPIEPTSLEFMPISLGRDIFPLDPMVREIQHFHHNLDLDPIFSSICDFVTEDFTDWVTLDPGVLWPLRHLIRVLRKHDVINILRETFSSLLLLFSCWSSSLFLF